MATLEIVTWIDAPVERVFDLSLSIDLHVDSTAATGERAIGGVTSGLIAESQEVTWRAKHFGIWWQMTVGITICDRPRHFTDAMIRGPFRRMRHKHRFEEINGTTRMTDQFEFQSPGWFLGTLADALVVRSHLRSLLVERNRVIKEAAEGEGWRKYLQGENTPSSAG